MADERDEITLTVDGQSVTVPAGSTLLQAAAALGIEIPTVCYHPHLTANGLCRVCAVEVDAPDGSPGRLLQAACVARAAPGMVVRTDGERVRRSRRTLVELLLSAVDCSEADDIQQYAADLDADPNRFGCIPGEAPDACETRAAPVIDDNPMYVRDYAKCILCWRCVQVCAQDAQYTYAINFGGRGFDTHIATFFDGPMMDTTCVFCGQCVQACPTGALKPRRAWLLEQGLSPDAIVQMSRGERRRHKRAKPVSHHTDNE